MLTGIAIVLAGLVLIVVLGYARKWHWTGVSAVPPMQAGGDPRPAKTLWDWLQLLGIPLALAALAFFLEDAQKRRDQDREDTRVRSDVARALVAAREETLRTYLAQMSDLVLNHRLLPGCDRQQAARSRRRAPLPARARTAPLTDVDATREKSLAPPT